MAESTITSKGQTTVPQAIRDALHAEPGTRLHWNLTPDGSIVVRAKTLSIKDLRGILKAPTGTHVSIEDMNPWH
jgi:antitoxin PrlF